MSKYISINTFYLSINRLKNLYEKDEKRSIDYKRIGIEYNDGRRKNLSQLMYSKIKKKKSRLKSEIIQVDPKSYIKTRHIVIDAIAMLIIEDTQKGLADISIRSSVHRYINFVDWLNSAEIALPVNLKTAREAYRTYTLLLRERLRKGTLKNGTAHIKQVSAVKILEKMFDDPENTIVAFINNIPEQIIGMDYIRTVRDEDVKYAFNFYYSFFDQVTDFLLEKKYYPHKLIFQGYKAIILPRESLSVVPLNSNWGQLGQFIDTENGIILSEKETKERVKSSKDWNEIVNKNQWSRLDRALKTRQKTITAIELANEKLQGGDSIRFALGERAMKAYYMVLLALTGMNDVNLAMMIWDEEGFDEEKLSHEFMAIKARAKNKKVLFEIQKEFMPSFKKYLQLRNFILDGYKSDYLFFTGSGKNAKTSNSQRDGSYSANIWYGSFKRFDPNLPNVLSKDFRIYKTKWIRNESGLFVAASMAQHSIQISNKHYSGETEEEQTGQVENFLSTVHNRVTEDKRKETDTNVIAGTCDDYGVPEALEKKVSIIPDCHKPEGCFFCTKHRLHPDEEDIRKLISLEYIIQEVSICNARSLDHFNQVMNPVLEKIEEKLIDLKDYKDGIEKLINEIRIDVFEKENLTPYWEHKLAMMYRMGVVK